MKKYANPSRSAEKKEIITHYWPFQKSNYKYLRNVSIQVKVFSTFRSKVEVNLFLDHPMRFCPSDVD